MLKHISVCEEPQTKNQDITSKERTPSVIAEIPDYEEDSIFPDYESSFYEGHDVFRNELINPSWIEDEELGNGPKEFIPQVESKFFQVN